MAACAQLARDELGNATAPCGAGHAFVMVDGRALCDPDDLQKALDKLTYVACCATGLGPGQQSLNTYSCLASQR
jgi:hypothetical protein